MCMPAYLHESLVQARQDDLLRTAAHHRLAVGGRQARSANRDRMAAQAGLLLRAPARRLWRAIRPLETPWLRSDLALVRHAAKG